MNINIRVKDINKLSLVDVTALYTRLSHPDSQSASSMRPELEKRYLTPTIGPHPEMAIALVWCDNVLVGWVGSRPWKERFKGDAITVQTVECFVDPEYRRRGFASLGMQALVTSGAVQRDKPVAVYAAEALNVARQCGCKTVLLCEAT